jgi:uncharacterized repeat protein (TIGR03837 family)
MLREKLHCATVNMVKPPTSSAPLRVDIFCRVVDNLGDVGVCWRLARQLHDEFGCAVRLVVDDLAPFAIIETLLDRQLEEQSVRAISMVRWDAFHARCDAVLVIEAFACNPPDAYVQSMATQARKPLWINLEYLSAEAWVDGVHSLPSPHPKLPLTKYFFVPGFSEKSGGILRERSVGESTNAIATHNENNHTKLFAFAYPHAPLRALADGFAAANERVEISLASSVTDTANDWAQLKSVPQTEFDALLSGFDLLIVRGEDSFVRAQLAGKPMLWHIYPTEDRAHIAKLDAWLQRYCAPLDDDTAQIYRRAAHAFVDPALDKTDVLAFADLVKKLPELRTHALKWKAHLLTQTDLATALLRFFEDKREDHV